MYGQTKSRVIAAWLVGLTAAVLVSQAKPAQAGWTQPEGSWYLKIWDRSLFGSNAYVADGENLPLDDSYSDHALNVYFEYGVTDDWTLVAMSRPLGFASAADESTVYIGDTAAGVRRALLRGPLHLAAQVVYGYAPDVGTDPLDSGELGGFPYVYAPTVETHRIDGTLQAGVGFDWGWLALHSGAGWRSADGLDPVLDEFVQLGWASDFGLYVAGYAAYHHPLGDIELTNVSGAGQTRYLGFGLDVSYWFGEARRVGLTAGMGGALLAESNAATAPFMFGVELR